MKPNTQQNLLEFAFKLSDIQIKKYQKLSQVGIGPDASVSAGLIRLQVAEQLKKIEELLQKKDASESELVNFAQALKFDLDCEYIRGRAGWLLDENPIHNTVYERVTEQLSELRQITDQLDEWEELKEPASKQMPHLYRSHAIAFRILDLVAKLKENPDRDDLGRDNNLDHGLMIMRGHARLEGRYHQEAISEEINLRHTESKKFLESSPIAYDKNELNLTKEQAKAYAAEDRAHLNKMLGKFLENCPDGEPARQAFKWYEVANINKALPEKTEPRKSSSLLKWGLFGAGVLGAAGLGVYAATADENGQNNLLRMLGLS